MMFGKKRSEQSNPTSSCSMFFRRFFRKENPQISPTDSQMPLRRLYVFFKPEQSSGYGGSLRKRDGFVVHHGVDARAIPASDIAILGMSDFSRRFF